jgi:CBS domain-containing protein
VKTSDVMVGEVTTCKPTMTLESIALSMWDNNCGCVPVIDEADRPIGIITDRDIAISAALRYRPLWEIQASDVTNNRPLYTCKKSDGLDKALKLMQKHQVRRLPVIDKQGKLVGVISIGDIIAMTEEQELLPESFAATMKMLKSVSAHHPTKEHQVATA